MKKKLLAMLLAGGQGSRLGILTQRIAKPAVPFGGKYRIIDFPLSNCSNSGIDVVGVLTQYRPLELNTYLGTGLAWDLDRADGGIFVLPPYHTGKTGTWYKGTANAIYQNIAFIEQYSPEYVLILSGDHIYKMDYDAMLSEHIKNNADVTIASIEVPWEEASRFGILNTNEDGSIVEFDEKPAKPRSNKASMGIYIFTWEMLKKYLTEDEAKPDSSNDFGKDVLPAMLNDGRRMFSYAFEGYWKDVGTIESLWQANMDLLESPPVFDLYEDTVERDRIYSHNPVQPPHYISAEAEVGQSIITEGCEIYGSVNHSVMFAGVIVEKGASVLDSIAMSYAQIGEGSRLEKVMVSEHAVIGKNCVIGGSGAVTVIGEGVVVPDNTKIPAGLQIGPDYFK
ncbi:MAG: glucose-1-phosphate adenylyltransferase [Clostridiales bacterium]|nr:glucose-1-phosphate adenylyltransferase [Clostridiales bacterium]